MTKIEQGPTAVRPAPHINADGLFQSDKYPACPPGKVPLSTSDKSAQDLLWTYAQRRRSVDAQFANDLETCLKAEGYAPPVSPAPGEDVRSPGQNTRDAVNLLRELADYDMWTPCRELDISRVKDLITAAEARGREAERERIAGAFERNGSGQRFSPGTRV